MNSFEESMKASGTKFVPFTLYLSCAIEVYSRTLNHFHINNNAVETTNQFTDI